MKGENRMRLEQEKSIEKEIGRNDRAGEEKEGRKELRENGSGKGLGEGREEREMKKEQLGWERGLNWKGGIRE